jgi:hypothetical protein
MCGPFALARVGGGAEVDRFAIVEELARRATYFSHWAAERLLSAYAGDRLALRRNPASIVRGSRVSWCRIEQDATSFFKRRWMRATLDEEALEVFERLEGDEEVIAALVEGGLLVAAPQVPLGVFRPLEVVRAVSASWPEGQAIGRELSALEGLIARFAGGDLAARTEASAALEGEFSRITGASAIRGEGEHYADRGLLHEDCCAELRAELSASTIGVIEEAVEPLIAAAVLPMELARENVRVWFREVFGEGRAVSLLEVHEAFDRDTPYARVASSASSIAISAAIERVRDLISRAVGSAEGGIASIGVDEMRAAAAVPLAPRPGYASADIMLARGPGGRTMVVVGEMHGFYMFPTFWLDTVPVEQRERTLAELRGLLSSLAGGRPTLEALFAHTQATDRRYPIAGADLMVIGRSDRAGAHEIGELSMMLEGDRFRFEARGREVVPVTIYSAYPFFSYTSSVAPLIDEFAGRFFPRVMLPAACVDGDAPRIMLGGVVFRRASWTRTVASLRSSLAAEGELALLLASRALRSELGWRGPVFASIPGEPKPLFLDLENLFLVEAFERALHRAPDDGAVRFTEMLPGPEELFFEAPDGPRTFELRIGIYRGA